MLIINKQKLPILMIALLSLSFILHGLYIPIKAELSQYLLERAWQTSIEVQKSLKVKKGFSNNIKPWPWADTYPVAKLIFEQQQKTQIVLAGSSGRTMAFAPGHLDGSAKPGELGHVIISAHRDTHFNYLQFLQLGDTLKLKDRTGLVRSYKISAIRIVDSRYEPLILESATNLLTLITCYPFDAVQSGGPLRYRIDATLEL